jgi:hypothetical protein
LQCLSHRQADAAVQAAEIAVVTPGEEAVAEVKLPVAEDPQVAKVTESVAVAEAATGQVEVQPADSAAVAEAEMGQEAGTDAAMATVPVVITVQVAQTVPVAITPEAVSVAEIKVSAASVETTQAINPPKQDLGQPPISTPSGSIQHSRDSSKSTAYWN